MTSLLDKLQNLAAYCKHTRKAAGVLCSPVHASILSLKSKQAPSHSTPTKTSSSAQYCQGGVQDNVIQHQILSS